VDLRLTATHGADHAQGRERIAQDEARTPQAPPREDEYLVSSGPNLAAGSGFSSSKTKDDYDST
jgi:hypothetical protein